MKIISIEAENFKRLQTVYIEPNGDHAIIGGNNRQGKTSTLDAIEAALGGKKHCPDEPIRRGKKKARIVLKTDDLTITRTFDKTGTKLKIEGVDKKPQDLLNTFWGKLSFDPGAFANMEAKEQAETLRSMAGLDFAELNAERQRLFDERTLVNRDGKAMRARLDAAPHHKDAPGKRVDPGELLAGLERRIAAADQHKTDRDKLGEASRALIAHEGLIADLTADLASATKNLPEYKNAKNKAAAIVAGIQDPDIGAARAALGAAEANNQKVADNETFAELQAEMADLESQTVALKRDIEAIDERKAEAIEAAQYPVEGLAVDDDTVTLNGVPFQQASQSEQLGCGVAIGAALNKGARFMLVRDGSSFDPESRALLLSEATKAGVQILMEVVGKGGGATVIIEDGQVLGDDDGE